MTWAQRLKRVLNIDTETCEQHQKPIKVIACVEGPVAIQQILDHKAMNSTANDYCDFPQFFFHSPCLSGRIQSLRKYYPFTLINLM
jgi:hypothetical protein